MHADTRRSTSVRRCGFERRIAPSGAGRVGGDHRASRSSRTGSRRGRGRAARAASELTFEFVDPRDVPDMLGEVTDFDPPRRFAFTWGEDHLQFALEPVDGGETELRLHGGARHRGKAARDGAGWHVCLARLERRSTEPAIRRSSGRRRLARALRRVLAPRGSCGLRRSRKAPRSARPCDNPGRWNSAFVHVPAS